MSMQGTPISSQFIWYENRVHKLEEQIKSRNVLLIRTLVFLESVKAYGPLRTDIEELLENES